jgi:predicted glutamine amidotransferase
MCIIAISPKGVDMFDKLYVETMFKNNPDGAGIAYFDEDKNKVFMRKGFMSYEDLQNYLDSISDPTNKEIVLHCRFATSGELNGSNCHPFPIKEKIDNSIEGYYDTVMFHNGVLDYNGWKGTRYKSDTVNFIENCINNLPDDFLSNPAICDLISKAIGTNKLCFVSKNGIRLFGNYEYDNGFIYSNLSYRPVIRNFNKQKYEDLLHKKFPSASIEEIGDLYWIMEFKSFEETEEALDKLTYAGDGVSTDEYFNYEISELEDNIIYAYL